MNPSFSIDRKSIRGLLSDVEARRFAIPKLQREFVWDGRKAAKLLDSIVRGLPVGTLIVWQVDRSRQLSIRQDYSLLPVFDHKHSQIWFVMDGQWRISVLHHVQTGDVQENASGQEVDFERVVIALADDDSGEVERYRLPDEEEFISLSAVLDPRFRQRVKRCGELTVDQPAGSV